MGNGCPAGCSEVPGEVGHPAGHQPGWPQGGFGEGSGLPSSARVNGSYPCFSGTLEPVFPCGVRFLLVTGLGKSGRTACSLHSHPPWIWPHSTCQITPHRVCFCWPPALLCPRAPGLGSGCKPAWSPPTPNSTLTCSVHVRGLPCMGMPMEQVPLGSGCPRDVGAGELGLIGAALSQRRRRSRPSGINRRPQPSRRPSRSSPG